MHVAPGYAKADLSAAMENHILEQAELVAIYTAWFDIATLARPKNATCYDRTFWPHRHEVGGKGQETGCLLLLLRFVFDPCHPSFVLLYQFVFDNHKKVSSSLNQQGILKYIYAVFNG